MMWQLRSPSSAVGKLETQRDGGVARVCREQEAFCSIQAFS